MITRYAMLQTVLIVIWIIVPFFALLFHSVISTKTGEESFGQTGVPAYLCTPKKRAARSSKG